MTYKHSSHGAIASAVLVGGAVVLAVVLHQASIGWQEAALQRLAEARTTRWSAMLGDALSLSEATSADLAPAAGGHLAALVPQGGDLETFRVVGADGIVNVASDGEPIGVPPQPSAAFDDLRRPGVERQVRVSAHGQAVLGHARLPDIQRGLVVGALEMTVDLSEEAAIIGAAFDRFRLYGAGALLLLLAGALLAVHAGVAARRAVSRRLVAAQQGALADRDARLEMLAYLSHQLRTPLNTIMGFSEAIRRELFGAAGSPQYKDYAAAIHDAGSQVLRTLADVIDLAQPQAETATDEAEVNVVAVAEQALETMQSAADARDVQLSLVTRKPVTPLRGDRQLMLRMLSALLSHAIGQSVRGGQCRLTLTREADGAAVFQASDASTTHGPGEPGLSFALSGRLDSPPATRGAGAGLALAKILAERQGGTVELSNRIGGGTCIRIRFPAARSLGIEDTAVSRPASPIHRRVAAKLATAG